MTSIFKSSIISFSITLLITLSVQAQSLDTLALDKYELVVESQYVIESHYNAEGAKSDIKSGKTLILFSGGFGGMPNFKNQKDEVFQRKYDVTFFSKGCVSIGVNEDEIGYNKVVFSYLDEKFGTGWRQEIRQDAFGLESDSSKTHD
ncbi:MAG: hypothetical protein AAFX87_14025 [Bacteroidota bacterium]